ncbi:MAG: PCYCGC motif-containing (lipo)protein [Anaerolineales bacterium]|nr:MAG: PCYCGC motif-containing (lipo)protein [Anaerolineales bacterium]
MFSKLNKFFFLLIVLALVGVAVSACSTSSSSEVHLVMAPMDQMPMDVQSAPVAVQEAYQFNVANPDIMQDIPCYCGCGDIGHTSNYDCYVSNVDAGGKITFDNHALGCSICVDITQDVMRMLNDGKSPQDARAYVDATYSKYGPTNIP